jgi:hypothetical protein
MSLLRTSLIGLGFISHSAYKSKEGLKDKVLFPDPTLGREEGKAQRD